MKKLNCLILLILAGCGPSAPTSILTTISEGMISRDIHLYVIDSCEYIGDLGQSSWDILTHKGNCKFCKERNKK